MKIKNILALIPKDWSWKILLSGLTINSYVTPSCPRNS